MRRQEVLDKLRRRPFQPIRLHVTDGATFEIRHPEMVLVTRHSALVGQPEVDSPPPAIEQYVLVDLLHITRIETIASRGPTKDNGL